MGETRPIEWPPRSGVVAQYAPHEERFLRELIDGCERGEFSQDDLARQVGTLHELKADLDARIVPEAPREDLFGEMPPPDSPFQIPPRAAEKLAAYDPQLRIA